VSFLSKMQRYETLRSDLDADYKTFELQYRDLNDFILPSRGRFQTQDRNRGDRRNHKILDITAYLSARTLSSGMVAGVMSPARNWKRLTTPDPELGEFGPVKEWLHIVDTRMSNAFLRSNLYNVTPTAFGDLGVFGTPAIMMEEDNLEISRFYSFPVGSFRIAKDRRGRVNRFVREFGMTVANIVAEFGQKDDQGDPDWSNISQHVRSMYERGNYESWIDVIHVIEPNQDYASRKLDSKFKRFGSCYYEKGSGDSRLDAQKFLRERGYDYFPVFCPRWSVTGQDVYATDCPGMAAIGDIKQLQHGERRIAQAIDKMVNPSMIASSGLKTAKASIISGDITYLEDQNRDFFKAAHEVRIDLSHIENKQTQVRQRIQRAFFEDLFLMLAQSDRREFTATEIMERKEEKLLAVGPVLEQLNQDFLDPLIDAQFLLMSQQGLFPPAPQELQGQDLKVEYISIMAQAQKMVGIGGLDRLLQIGTQIMSVSPGTAVKFDFDQIVDEYAEALGTSPRVIRSDEKVEEIRNAQAEAAAAQQKMQMIEQGAAVAKNLAGANMEGDNALSRLSERLTGQV